jgi:hypothetical protein
MEESQIYTKEEKEKYRNSNIKKNKSDFQKDETSILSYLKRIIKEYFLKK